MKSFANSKIVAQDLLSKPYYMSLCYVVYNIIVLTELTKMEQQKMMIERLTAASSTAPKIMKSLS